jgi:hypothetical protein
MRLKTLDSTGDVKAMASSVSKIGFCHLIERRQISIMNFFGLEGQDQTLKQDFLF